MWKRNSDNATCTQKAINDEETTMGACDTSMKNVVAGGNGVPTRYECEITIPSASWKDTGTWTCMLTSCKGDNEGGCNAEEANDCIGASSSVNVTVLNILLYAKHINYIFEPS